MYACSRYTRRSKIGEQAEISTKQRVLDPVDVTNAELQKGLTLSDGLVVLTRSILSLPFEEQGNQQDLRVAVNLPT